MRLFIITLLITFNLYSQSNVPEKYWLDDKAFEEKVIGSAFDDNESETILIEFWAKFNEANCFADWPKIKNAKYYRIDISKAPATKKKYRVRMAPTLIIFKNGEKQVSFKAGLDLLLPADLAEIQEAINEVNTANSF